MESRTIAVANRAGIHVRPSGIIISEVKKLKGKITIEAKGFTSDLKNVMILLAMGLVKGDEIHVSVEHKNPSVEKADLEVVCELLSREYDFPGK